MNPKVICVTGCAGFIGSSFCRQFKSKFPDSTIIGIDDLSTGKAEEVDGSTTFYKGSITDEVLVNKIFSTHHPEYVFHFAALPRISFSMEFPIRTNDVNATGTVTLLDAAHKHGSKRFIFSSSSVYGGADKLPTKESENPPNPKSPYAIQKYVGELYCKAYSELFGLDTVCLRYFTVFGPGQYGDSPYSTIVSAWLESLYFPDNKDMFIEGDGTQSRDFCYIDNVVQANILAMEKQGAIAGEIINVAHGYKTSVNELLELLQKYTNKKLEPERRPPRPGDVRHTHADISKARQVLGYEPVIGLDEGLKRTVEWFESRTK